VKNISRLFLVLGLALGGLLLGGCAGLGGGDPSGKRAEVVSAALAQVGTPYVYGGNQPGRGLDCSGLTWYAHQAVGVRIPRMAVDQQSGAKPVNAKSPHAGDLVFFKTGPGVHHVGLMVDGDRFVHASTSRHEVGLARLRAPYWTAHYLGAGTYLP
jgi:cell wall-associated NlpC family hydrolase